MNKRVSPEQIAEGIRSGNRRFIAKGITLLESLLPADKDNAEKLLELILPYTGNALRLGITGVPGVGKSTFIENFGLHAIEQGRKVAVLAIDPSSARGGGSILGDKTRMVHLATDPAAYIRPTPSGSMSGGVAFATREAIFVCEAAGFDLIIVETVGVGQSDVLVDSMTDCFMALMLPGAGDELQGIKRGIMEMGDIFVVNKADGERMQQARIAKMQIQQGVHLMSPKRTWWAAQTLLCSALEKQGIEEIYTLCMEFYCTASENNALQAKRREQALLWMESYIRNHLITAFFENENVQQHITAITADVQAHRISPMAAGRKMLSIYLTDRA
jgi:LAO/AO transport system kinase